MIVQGPPPPKQEGRVGAHVKRYGGDYVKLIAAVTALVVAVNGYLELAGKDEVVYQALSSKVNRMAEDISGLKAQNEVVLLFLQAKFGGKIIPDKSPPELSGSIRGSRLKASPEAPRLKSKPVGKVIVRDLQKLPKDLDTLMRQQRPRKLERISDEPSDN